MISKINNPYLLFFLFFVALIFTVIAYKNTRYYEVTILISTLIVVVSSAYALIIGFGAVEVASIIVVFLLANLVEIGRKRK